MTGKICACYERLSRDDELQGESNSISNQKYLLEEYAKQNGFSNIRHFTDDGYSGTRFDRPAFMAMMAEVEQGNINIICLKDMSRMGRDYLKVGQYMELLRQRGIRLIAINDNVDSFKGDDDFTPFRNIMNEWMIRDTSRKIKSVFKAKGLSGKHTASSPPYGYLKSPIDKEQWIIDEVASEIVKRVFRLTMEGNGPYRIARILEDDNIPIPALHQQRLGLGLHQHKDFAKPFHWQSSTVASMLKRREYLGHTVNFKTKKHFKDKKSHYVDEKEWVVFENTHEQIVDKITFDNVQRIRSNVKRYPDGWGEYHILTGLVYCSDCGSKLYVHRQSNGKNIPKYVCGNYGKVPVGTRCKSGHRVDVSIIIELIKSSLKGMKKHIDDNKGTFIKSIGEKLSDKQSNGIKHKQNRLIICENRLGELKVLLSKIYEDNTFGKLSDKQYENLNTQYEGEQNSLEEEIVDIQKVVTCFDDGKDGAKHFLSLINKYDNFEDLTPIMLNEFIEKIVVYERDRKGSQDTTQRLDIHFNFIGQYILPSEPIDPQILLAQQEEERKKQATKDRLHQNYLKRKANGKEAKYYEEYKAKRKQRIDELKAENPNTYGIPLNEFKQSEEIEIA